MPIRWAGFLAFRVDDSLSARDKAIMELFYSSGLRLAELVSLSSASGLGRFARAGCFGKAARLESCPSAAGLDALKVWLKSCGHGQSEE